MSFSYDWVKILKSRTLLDVMSGKEFPEYEPTVTRDSKPSYSLVYYNSRDNKVSDQISFLVRTYNKTQKETFLDRLESKTTKPNKVTSPVDSTTSLRTGTERRV